MTGEDDLGWVYCLSNPSFRDGLVKIGLSRRNDLNERMDELYNTSVPTPFKLELAGKFKNCGQVEKNVHALLSHFRSRVNDQREFFECSMDDVMAAFKSQSPCGEFVVFRSDEKVQVVKPSRDYNIFEHMQRIRHVKNGDVLYGHWDEMHKCFRLEDDPECTTFISLTAFERYHLEKLDMELKGGGNGWRNCEVEISDDEWVRASSYQEDKQLNPV